MSSHLLKAPRAVRRATAILAGMAALAAPGCVGDPESKTCASGIYCPAGTKCAANQAVCLLDDCGDGVLQPGEACDDGDVLDGMAASSGTCNHDCTSSERCGNGITDAAMGEACDDARAPGGCSDDCRSTGLCGNRLIDVAFGEQCDDGELTAFCTSLCRVSIHGDGFVNPLDVDAAVPGGEQCDGDGLGQANGWNCEWEGCNFNCTRSRPGDGIVNALDGEECDDGDGSLADDCESATCDANCTTTVCGDGYPNPLAEGCDDGNALNTDDCLTTCVPNVCGDGFLDQQAPVLEACDLGVANGLTQCPYGATSCTGCTTSCTVNQGMQTSYCGDGRLDTARERCDHPSSFECGTCDDAACTVVGTANAAGTITVKTTSIADGEFLTLGDGLGHAVTIEFDTDGACVRVGARCVHVVAASTIYSIAASVDAILDGLYETSELTISSRRGSTNVLSLTNTDAGMKGNVATTTGATSGSPTTVVVAPADGAVVVDGLRGGVGCPLGDSCFANADCVSRDCSAFRCR